MLDLTFKNDSWFKEFNIIKYEKDLKWRIGRGCRMNILIAFLAVFFKYFMADTQSRYPVLYFIIIGCVAVLCVMKVYGQLKTHTMTDIGNWPVTFFLMCTFLLLLTMLSRDANFLLPLLLAIAFSYESCETFLRCFFVASLVCFLGHMALFSMGILDSAPLTRLIDGVMISRSTLGFGHPNSAFGFFAPVFLLAYINYAKKWPIPFYIISVICTLFIYNRTNSRTGFMLICFFIFLTLLYRNNLLNRKPILLLFRCSYFLFAGLTLLTASLFGPNLQSSVTIALTGRPYLWNCYLSNGILLIGKGFAQVLPSYMVLPQYGDSIDNYYVFLLMYFGWVIFFIFGIFYYLMFYKMEKAERIDLMLISVAFLVYGLTEENPIIPSINFSLIFLFVTYINPNYFLSPTTKRNTKGQECHAKCK